MSNSLRKWQECCQRTEPDLGTGHDCDGKALVRETIELAFRFLSGRFKAGSSLARANEVQSVVGQHSQVCLRCICKLARNDVTEDPLSQSVTNLSHHDLSSVLNWTFRVASTPLHLPARCDAQCVAVTRLGYVVPHVGLESVHLCRGTDTSNYRPLL